MVKPFFKWQSLFWSLLIQKTPIDVLIDAILIYKPPFTTFETRQAFRPHEQVNLVGFILS